MSSPISDATICAVSSRITHLGQALEPVAKGLHRALVCEVELSGREFLLMDDLVRHIGAVQQALSHLSSGLEDLMGNVISNDSATMGDAYRAAGRFEKVLSAFVDGYHEIKSLHDGPDSGDARALMLGVYCHYLREISTWLDEMVGVIANPTSALQRRGLTPTGGVELPVVLRITVPPQMTKLNKFAKSLQVPLSRKIEEFPEEQPPEPPLPRATGTLGALAFGFAVSKAVFGR